MELAVLKLKSIGSISSYQSTHKNNFYMNINASLFHTFSFPYINIYVHIDDNFCFVLYILLCTGIIHLTKHHGDSFKSLHTNLPYPF